MSTTRKRLSNEARASRPAFQERVFQAAKGLEDRCHPVQSATLSYAGARRMDIANHMNEWLSSPVLRPPK
jgi:hypothetical protein